MSIETNIEQGAGMDRLDTGASAAAEPRVELRREHDEEFALELRSGSLAEVCQAAIADLAARFPDRAVEYSPDPDPERHGTAEFDARRLAYAVTILLEDALKRTTQEEPVSLRWREHDGVIVLRVQFPRPLERGDRFVTYFEDGVLPDGADDRVGTLRLVVARKIVLQHRGHLARIRTFAGTAYVATLPRSAASAAGEADGDL